MATKSKTTKLDGEKIRKQKEADKKKSVTKKSAEKNKKASGKEAYYGKGMLSDTAQKIRDRRKMLDEI